MRFPSVLGAKMDGEVRVRRQEPGGWKFSMNDLVVEAVRKLLDGGESRTPAPGVRGGMFSGEPISNGPVTTSMPAMITAGSMKRAWFPELKRLQELGQQNEADARDEFTEMVGVEFVEPKGWPTWDLKRRAAWLDAKHPLESS